MSPRSNNLRQAAIDDACRLADARMAREAAASQSGDVVALADEPEGAITDEAARVLFANWQVDNVLHPAADFLHDDEVERAVIRQLPDTGEPGAPLEERDAGRRHAVIVMVGGSLLLVSISASILVLTGTALVALAAAFLSYFAVRDRWWPGRVRGVHGHRVRAAGRSDRSIFREVRRRPIRPLDDDRQRIPDHSMPGGDDELSESSPCLLAEPADGSVPATSTVLVGSGRSG
ncbi:hypothetical protein [Actinoplanes subglobosus]|uniref:Uncharacterized protein n=1 Tax=Actinoplanes subglobosus TaxID=1547892 RepID=A0ABV8ITW1_9ACTN